jgi:hypothetical protein
VEQIPAKLQMLLLLQIHLIQLMPLKPLKLTPPLVNLSMLLPTLTLLLKLQPTLHQPMLPKWTQMIPLTIQHRATNPLLTSIKL